MCAAVGSFNCVYEGKNIVIICVVILYSYIDFDVALFTVEADGFVMKNSFFFVQIFNEVGNAALIVKSNTLWLAVLFCPLISQRNNDAFVRNDIMRRCDETVSKLRDIVSKTRSSAR